MANSADPLGAFRFRVEIQSLVEAGFAECSGLQAEIEVEEVQEGGLNEFVHRLPKGSKQVNLTLKRGLATSDKLWKWYEEVAQGKIRRRTVNVFLLDAGGQQQWNWTFKEAYPVRWTGPELKADGSAIAVESLELVHNGFTLTKLASQ